MRISGIYAIKNSENGKLYIGSSNDITKRFNSHKNKLNKHQHLNKYLQSAWVLSGGGAFEFYVLEKCDESELLKREDYYIAAHKTLDNHYGYNLIPADRCALRVKGRRMSEEAKQKISIAHKGKPLNPEHCRRIKETHEGIFTGSKHPMWGKHHNPEARRKMSQSHKGIFCGSNHSQWGTHRSAETVLKLSIAMKGKPWTDARRKAFELSKNKTDIRKIA